MEKKLSQMKTKKPKLGARMPFPFNSVITTISLTPNKIRIYLQILNKFNDRYSEIGYIRSLLWHQVDSACFFLGVLPEWTTL